MTYEELVAEITRLPQEQRLSLLEVLTQSLHEALAPPPGQGRPKEQRWTTLC